MDSRFTLFDVCQATQKDLERFFLHSGCCFGDLRRMQLMAAQMTKRTMQMYRAMLNSMRPSAAPSPISEDAFIQSYFDQFLLKEQYPEDGQPRFCGGPLEKTRLSQCQERDKWHRMEENIRAGNAKKHQFARPSASRQSHRQLNRLSGCTS